MCICMRMCAGEWVCLLVLLILQFVCGREQLESQKDSAKKNRKGKRALQPRNSLQPLLAPTPSESETPGESTALRIQTQGSYPSTHQLWVCSDVIKIMWWWRGLALWWLITFIPYVTNEYHYYSLLGGRIVMNFSKVVMHLSNCSFLGYLKAGHNKEGLRLRTWLGSYC